MERDPTPRFDSKNHLPYAWTISKTRVFTGFSDIKVNKIYIYIHTYTYIYIWNHPNIPHAHMAPKTDIHGFVTGWNNVSASYGQVKAVGEPR